MKNPSLRWNKQRTGSFFTAKGATPALAGGARENTKEEFKLRVLGGFLHAGLKGYDIVDGAESMKTIRHLIGSRAPSG